MDQHRIYYHNNLVKASIFFTFLREICNLARAPPQGRRRGPAGCQPLLTRLSQYSRISPLRESMITDR